MPVRRYITAAIKIVVGGTLLYFLFRQADSKDLGALLEHASWPQVLSATLCLVVAAGLNAVRWQSVLALLGERVRLATTLTGTFEGMFFNLFLPTSVGGDAVRAYRAFDRGANGPLVIESALIDRAIGLWGVGLTLLLATPFAASVPQIASYQAVVIISAVIVLGGAVAVGVGRLVDPARFKGWLYPLARLMHDYAAVVASARFFTRILPVLLLSSGLTCATMWLSARALGFDLGLPDAAIVLQASTLAALLPVSFGGWGVREGVTVYLLSATGLDVSGAFAVSVLFGVTLAALGLIGAIVWISSPYRGAVRFSAMRHGGPIQAKRENHKVEL